MDRLRLVTALVGGLALGLAVLGLGGAVYFAPPHAENALRGIQVQATGGDPSTTILPRNGLACSEGPRDPLVTTCRATVGATTLVVTLTRPEAGRWAFATCTATYGERTTVCRAGFPPYAVVDGASLGLAPAALAALHPAWSPEGWHAETWRRAFLALAASVALGLAALALNVPLDGPRGRVAAAVATGLTVFFLSAPLFGFALVALGYID